MIDYSAYIKVCREAAENDLVFETFKRHLDYIPILEHVNYEQGVEYIKEIRHNTPILFESIDKFKTNDSVGKPYLRYFPLIETEISPTTLRYIKVLGDLALIFGSLDGLDIVEIGGGYGGQCKIINDMFTPRSYTIVDFPDALLLTKKYLAKFDIEVHLRIPEDNTSTHYNLLISNYAFSECERRYQELYKDRIIRFCDKGYMTCNFIVPENMTKDEIISLKENFRIYEERPLTAQDNLIYTWQ